MNLSKEARLAADLPPRLLRFFQRFPPPQLFPNNTPPATPVPQTNALTAPSVTSTTSPTDPNALPSESVNTSASLTTHFSQIAAESASELGYHNPFLPRKNYKTGKWYGPVYGLRKQADLVKLAHKHGVLDLLPYTVKKPGEKEKRRIENGLRVKGTGVGQKVKGKVWERTLKGRLEERRQAMLNMPAMIQEWKQRGHGRGWKKWPK